MTDEESMDLPPVEEQGSPVVDDHHSSDPNTSHPQRKIIDYTSMVVRYIQAQTWQREDMITLPPKVDWHPTSSLLVSGGKDKLVKLKVARIRRQFSLYTSFNVKVDQNGYWLLTASKDKQNYMFYDVRAMSFRGHIKDVTSLAWHPFYKEKYSLGGSRSICHWTVGYKNPQIEIRSAYDNNIWDWHPFGSLLCSGSNDHTTRFWCRNRHADNPSDAVSTMQNQEIYVDNTDSEVIKIGGRNNREKKKQPNEFKKQVAETRLKIRDAQPVPEEPIPLRDYGDGSIVRLDWEHGKENLFGPILFQQRNDCWALSLRAILQFKVNEGAPTEQQVDLDTEGLIKSLKQGEVDLALGSLNGAIRYIRETGLEKKGGRKGANVFTKTGDFRTQNNATEPEIINLLENKGPVAITIADDYDFRHVKEKEIYHVKKLNDEDMKTMRHVIVIIGYGVLEDGQIFFIVRNTWGLRCGDKGYGRIILKYGFNIVYLNKFE